MKRLLVFVLAALALAAPAGATTGNDQRVQSEISQLKAQVKALSTQVKAMQTELKSLKRDAKLALNEAQVNYIGDMCLAAVTGDALVLTWMAIDQYMAGISQPALFGAQPFVNDKNACANLDPATARQQTLPITLNPFTSLMNWIVAG